MAIRIYKSITPGTRNRSVSDFTNLSKKKPEKSLLRKKTSKAGRNNRGVITIRHRSEEHTLNSSHTVISYAVFCLKKKKKQNKQKKTKQTTKQNKK